MSGADDCARRDIKQPRTPDHRGIATSGYGPAQRAPSPQQRGEDLMSVFGVPRITGAGVIPRSTVPFPEVPPGLARDAAPDSGDEGAGGLEGPPAYPTLPSAGALPSGQ